MIKIGFIFGLAIYGIIWFLTLFMVLPWGVVSQAEHGEVQPGSSESAPARPLIVLKLGITTLISLVFFLIVYWLLTSGALANINLPFFPDIPARP
jgi:predicted secreted protein